jgi:Leucine-rich repeat (LRR) protein
MDNLVNLKKLYLASNQFYEVPSVLYRLKNIRWLTIDDNKIDDDKKPNIKDFPSITKYDF